MSGQENAKRKVSYEGTRKRISETIGADWESSQIITEATELAKEQMARDLAEVIELAIGLCMGIKRKKFYPPHILELRLKTNPKARHFYYELEYDTAMIRFLIERFIPPAKTAMDLNVNSLEELYLIATRLPTIM